MYENEAAIKLTNPPVSATGMMVKSVTVGWRFGIIENITNRKFFNAKPMMKN